MGRTTVAEWQINANAREQRTFDVLNGADDEVDITGWTVDARIRTRPGGITLHTFPDEMIEVDPSGQVTLTIPAPTSAAWAWPTGWYRIRVEDPDSPDADNPDASRTLQGPVVVNPD